MNKLLFHQLPESNLSGEILLFDALNYFGLKNVAEGLGLHSNTVKRWLVNGKMPPSYRWDIARMLGREEKPTGIDQFYTKPMVASQCWSSFLQVCEKLEINTRKYHFIEPAAGCGWFYNLMPAGRREGIDIQPRPKDIHGQKLVQADFLTWKPRQQGSYAVVGNPPFGLRGHLALQFINHAATFADLVAFILPQLFESDGKGVPAKRVKNLSLAHTERLSEDSFETPDGKPLTVHTIFQVWTKINVERIQTEPEQTCKTFIRVYSLSDGGTPASTRNKKMLHACDVYLPSTCFSGMRAYRHFEELPHRRGYGVVIHKRKHQIRKLLMEHDWAGTAFPSTNSAVNLRRSLIESVVMDKGGYRDE